MSYSENALAFSTIPAGHQVRLEDRVSFAYLEHAQIVQDRTGVIALGEEDGQLVRQQIQIPVGSIAVVALGPGTSITHAAITSCTRAGATVLFCGGGGVPAYSTATPLTSSARWAIAQARLVSNEKYQREAAIHLYKQQFGLEGFDGSSITVMRGLEGRRMRDTYRELAQKHKIRGFKRDVSAGDDVNVALNIANAILYGCAASACAAIGVNPALGIIHRGDARSLLYDLADLYKPTIALPAAFAVAGNEDVPKEIRRRLRTAIVRDRLLAGMLGTLMTVLTPHLPNRDDDRLIGDSPSAEKAGHTQYGLDEDSDFHADETNSFPSSSSARQSEESD